MKIDETATREAYKTFRIDCARLVCGERTSADELREVKSKGGLSHLRHVSLDETPVEKWTERCKSINL